MQETSFWSPEIATNVPYFQTSYIVKGAHVPMLHLMALIYSQSVWLLWLTRCSVTTLGCCRTVFQWIGRKWRKFAEINSRLWYKKNQITGWAPVQYFYDCEVTFLRENRKFDPCKIESLEQIDTQLVRIDWVDEGNVLFPNLLKIRSWGPSGQTGEI